MGRPFSQHTIVPSTRIHDEASARAFAGALAARPRMATGYNPISGAIDFSAKPIRANVFEGRRKVIDVSGDRPNIGGVPLATHDGRDVIGGFGAFVVVARERKGSAEAILKKMMREIAGVPADGRSGWGATASARGAPWRAIVSSF